MINQYIIYGTATAQNGKGAGGGGRAEAVNA